MCPPEEGTARLETIYDAVRNLAARKASPQCPQQVLMITRTSSSVTVFSSKHPKPPAQIVLHTYPSIVDLLKRFDVELCLCGCFCAVCSVQRFLASQIRT